MLVAPSPGSTAPSTAGMASLCGASCPLPGNPCARRRQPVLKKHCCNLGRVEARGENLVEFSGNPDPSESPDGVLPPASATEEPAHVLRKSCEGDPCEGRVGGYLLRSWFSLAVGLQEWCQKGGSVSQVPGSAAGSVVPCLGAAAVPRLRRSRCNKTLWEVGKWEPQSVISALKRCCLSLLSLLGL